MLIPAYCPEDGGGPLSKKQALELLMLMQQRFAEETAKNQTTEGDHETFLHASGASEALAWAYDVLERTALDAETSKQAMLETARFLENEARNLRERAQVK